MPDGGAIFNRHPARTRGWWLLASAGLLGALLAAPTVGAQTGPEETKLTTATFTSTPPVIDGRVDDVAWEAAEVITDFAQKDPVAGAPPSQRTEVRILYDQDNLYFGWTLFDDNPEAIVATSLERDAFKVDDDHITMVLDTFHDHRNAFMFAANPLGTKFDWVITDESQVNGNWDEAWEIATAFTDEGWEAEVVIPFAILRYPTGTHVWGLELDRGIGRHREEINWNNLGRDYDWRAISQSGHLAGLENLKLTERFRLKPFATAGYDSLKQRDDPVSERTGEFGLEVFKIQLTPNLTANLTANTDFAQVEVDDQRVNLTRFSLFFPEKREFFLEANDSFTFGTLSRRGQGGGGGFGRQPPLALLFFSRRIGLGPDGEPVPIRFGGKLTGKVGSGTLGMLNVQTDDSQFGAGQNYTAVRWKQDVLGRSSIGALFTNVQGADGEFNRVFGADVDFTFFDHLFVSGFVAGMSDSDVEGAPWAGQFSVGWDTDKWGASGDVTYIEEDFDSDLGFILRRDIIRQNYQARWSSRPGWAVLRRTSLTGSLEHITDVSGRLVSRRAAADASLELDSGDRLTFSVHRNIERLDFDFQIDESVTIPIGSYSWTDGRITLRTTNRRWLSGNVSVDLGDFYDGTRVGIGGGPSIRFSERFGLQPEYRYNRVRLPGGEFETHLARVRANLHFSDRVLIDSLAQYSSVSDQLSLFARLRFIYRPGDDFYLVYRQTTASGGMFDGLDDRSLTAKMTYAFDW